MGRPPDTILRIESHGTSGTREPLGERLAVSYPDGRLRVYGGRGEVLHEWKPAGAGFVALAFSRDGGRIAGGARDGHVSVMEVETGRTVGTFAAHAAPVEALALSADGEVAVSGAGGSAAAFRVAGGARLYARESRLAEVSAVAVAPAGDRLAVAFTDVEALVVDVATGRTLVTISDLAMAPFGLAFSPDGRLLACGCADGVVSVRDAATGKRIRADVRHAEPVAAVAFSPDGSRLVSVGLSMNPGTRESSARTTPVAGGEPSADVLGVLPDVALGFTPDGVANVVVPGAEGARVWYVRPKPESRA